MKIGIFRNSPILNSKFLIPIIILNMSPIRIFLNGEERIIPHQMTIAELLAELELDVKKIAVEKDLEIVNQERFAEVILDEGSRVEIVHFIGGG